MTRSEAYAEGFQNGRRDAEEDARNGFRCEPPVHSGDRVADFWHAYTIGLRRGYRDTWARWDAGTLTWEMLEHAPVRAH